MDLAVAGAALGAVVSVLSIGGVAVAVVRQQARSVALMVTQAELKDHAVNCPWHASHESLTEDVKYVRAQVDWIKAYLLNGRKEGAHEEPAAR